MHRTSVFANACSALLSEDAVRMSPGPCVISPAFLASSPNTAPTHFSSQPSPSASSSQVIEHSITSSAWHSGIGVQPSTAPASAQQAEAGLAAVGGNVSCDVSPALREEGEGRGPRKEFFAAVGADIISAGCSHDSLVGLYWHVAIHVQASMSVVHACIIVHLGSHVCDCLSDTRMWSQAPWGVLT